MNKIESKNEHYIVDFPKQIPNQALNDLMKQDVDLAQSKKTDLLKLLAEAKILRKNAQEERSRSFTNLKKEAKYPRPYSY